MRDMLKNYCPSLVHPGLSTENTQISRGPVSHSVCQISQGLGQGSVNHVLWSTHSLPILVSAVLLAHSHHYLLICCLVGFALQELPSFEEAIWSTKQQILPGFYRKKKYVDCMSRSFWKSQQGSNYVGTVSHQVHASKLGKVGWGVAQWQSTCPACTRPWVPFLAKKKTCLDIYKNDTFV
jgi:hypothetical protein